MSSDAPTMTAAFVASPDTMFEVYGQEGLAAVGARARLAHEPVSRDELCAGPHPWTREVEVLFTSWGAPRMDAAMLARFPKLKAVFYGAGSSRALVTPEFWQRNIVLTTAAAANAIPVAEFTVAAVVFGLKQAWINAARTRTTRTFSRRTFEPAGVYGARVGLVSLGAIGRLVSERLHALQVEVAAYDPCVPAETFTRLGVIPLSLADLFATSSVVSLHAPLLPATKGMITGELIASMKTDATFINTARGALVREDELCAVLRARPDLQAVLDVTHPEPPAAESDLYTLPNVFLTPHLAGSRGRERRRLGELMIAEFNRYRSGQPLRHAVTATQARLLA